MAEPVPPEVPEAVKEAAERLLDEEGAGAVWVVSDHTFDGHYVATIHFSNDLSLPLDREGAIAYAMSVVTAAAEAEMDAAVLAQLTSLVPGDEKAAHIVMDLRDARPARAHVTGPVRWVPIVSSSDRRPYVQGYLRDEAPFTRWTPDEARQHAMFVLEVAATAPLDAAYRQLLIDDIGLPSGTASAAVHALRHERKLARPA